MLGIVTRFFKKSHKKKRPYGFIDGYDGESYFFSPMEGAEFKIGDEVSFRGSMNEKGGYAKDVKVVHP